MPVVLFGEFYPSGMNRSLLWFILGLSFATLTSSAQPNAAGMGRFCRSTEDESGQRLQLQVSSREYVTANGQGPRILLVGAVHIGDRSYYEALQRHLDAQDLVLFEGVKAGGRRGDVDDADDAARARRTVSRQRTLAVFIERHRAERGVYPATLLDLTGALRGPREALAKSSFHDGWGRPMSYVTVGEPTTSFDIISLGSDDAPGGEGSAADITFGGQKPLTRKELAGDDGIQAKLADALGLSFQLTEMNSTKANWRNSDLAIEEVQERLGEGNAAADAFFKMLEGGGITGRLVGIMLGFIKANPQMAFAMKMMMVEMLANADETLRSQARAGGMDLEKMMKVIINDRNEAVFEDLRKVLETEPNLRSIAIFYGAGHLPDMEQRLLGMGYRFDRDEWFTAIDLDLSRQPGGAAQATQMRQMVRRMMEQQRRTSPAGE